jgi:hypothetical protein
MPPIPSFPVSGFARGRRFRLHALGAPGAGTGAVKLLVRSSDGVVVGVFEVVFPNVAALE